MGSEDLMGCGILPFDHAEGVGVALGEGGPLAATSRTSGASASVLRLPGILADPLLPQIRCRVALVCPDAKPSITLHMSQVLAPSRKSPPPAVG